MNDICYIYGEVDGHVERHWGEISQSYIALEIQDEERFKNIKFLERLFHEFGEGTVVLYGDLNARKCKQAEQFLGTESLSKHGFLVHLEHSDSTVKRILDVTESTEMWSEWVIGFVPKAREAEIVAMCTTSTDQDLIWRLLHAGVFSLLVIRNFDCERLTIFSFIPEIFEDLRRVVESGLNVRPRVDE